MRLEFIAELKTIHAKKKAKQVKQFEKLQFEGKQWIVSPELNKAFDFLGIDVSIRKELMKDKPFINEVLNALENKYQNNKSVK